MEWNGCESRNPPQLDRSFLLKAVKIHLHDPHREEGAVSQTVFGGESRQTQLAAVCRLFAVLMCGGSEEESRTKPRHQSACRLSGIEPAGNFILNLLATRLRRRGEGPANWLTPC